MRRALVLCLAAALGAPAAAAAQARPDTAVPPPGVRMRVIEPDGVRHQGRFWYLSADTLWLLAPRSDSASPVRLAGDERIEITPGRRRERWSAGGALLGGALGLVVSLATADGGGPNERPHEIGQAVVATAAGTVTGGLLGWFVAPQRWRPVTLPPPPPPARRAAAPPSP